LKGLHRGNANLALYISGGLGLRLTEREIVLIKQSPMGPASWQLYVTREMCLSRIIMLHVETCLQVGLHGG